MSLSFTLFIVSLFFLLYETVGFKWADTLLASDEGQIKETGDSGKTVRIVFSALIFSFSTIVLLFEIFLLYSSDFVM